MTNFLILKSCMISWLLALAMIEPIHWPVHLIGPDNIIFNHRQRQKPANHATFKYQEVSHLAELLTALQQELRI